MVFSSKEQKRTSYDKSPSNPLHRAIGRSSLFFSTKMNGWYLVQATCDQYQPQLWFKVVQLQPWFFTGQKKSLQVTTLMVACFDPKNLCGPPLTRPKHNIFVFGKSSNRAIRFMWILRCSIHTQRTWFDHQNHSISYLEQ